MENNKQIPPALPDGEYLIGISQLMDFLGLSKATCIRLLNSGRIPHYKIGFRYFFEKAEVRESVRREVVKCFK